MSIRFDELQRVFIDALSDPRKECVLSEALSVEDTKRLDVYRNNMRSNLRAALKNAYPVLRALTGDAYFSDLARAYAVAHPSTSGDLNMFGAELASFIEEWEKDARYAYFSDMARLEWAIHRAYYAADVMAMDSAEWQGIDSRILLASSLAVNPACTAIRSCHAVFDLWRGHQANEALPMCVDVPACGLVIRTEWRPTVIDQSAAAHEAFLALQQGLSLDDAIDVALAVDPAFDIPTQLRAWIELRAITGPRDTHG